MVEVPPFDVDALRDNIESYPEPPDDPYVLKTIWKVFLADQLAAADHIDLLTYALKQQATA